MYVYLSVVPLLLLICTYLFFVNRCLIIGTISKSSIYQLIKVNSNHINQMDLVPESTTADVEFLAYLFGVKKPMIKEIKEFTSYSDRVFHIVVDKLYNIPSIVIKCSIGMSFEVCDFQIAIMKQLNKHGIPSPKPIELLPKYIDNIDKQNHNKFIYSTQDYPSINDINSKYFNKHNPKYPQIKHNFLVNVHCMTYIKGKFVDDITFKNEVNKQLFYNNIGITIGKMVIALQQLKSTGLDIPNNEDIWSLTKSDEMRNKLQYIQSQYRQTIVNHYFNLYLTHLVPQMKYLSIGLIHGDCNTKNVLFDENNLINCILDFGFARESYIIFDISFCCAYFILNKN
eukprot:172344_1